MSDDRFSPYLDAARGWYESQRSSSGHINTNVMTVGLIVSEMVAEGLPITSDRLYSGNRSQVRGLSGTSIARILARHDENRFFTSEGGRTSRGTLPLADGFTTRLNELHGSIPLTEGDLSLLSFDLEGFFTSCVQVDYLNKQVLEVEIDTTLPVAMIVSTILKEAGERADRQTGIVMQHLVGAKLQMRFPDIEIGRDRATTADTQLGRQGDFEVGTTAFHVTVAPSDRLIQKARQNRQAGYRPVLLVPSDRVQAAIQLADIHHLASQIMVQSVETFVGTNVEELAEFSEDAIRASVARLIKTYNERISSIESDLSLRIEEPAWMSRYS